MATSMFGGKSVDRKQSDAVPSSSRSLSRVHFQVEFCRERAGSIGQETSNKIPERFASRANCGVGVEGARVDWGRVGSYWVKGEVQCIDLRRKVLYIDNKWGIEMDVSATASNVDMCGASPQPLQPETPFSGGDVSHHNHSRFTMREGDKRASDYGGDRCLGDSIPKSVLDVRLLSCLSPENQELFNQLIAFSMTWKASTALEAVELVIDNAAALGQLFRRVVDEMIDQVVAPIVLATLAEAQEAQIQVAGAKAAAAAERAKSEGVQRAFGSMTVAEESWSRSRTQAGIGVDSSDSGAIKRPVKQPGIERAFIDEVTIATGAAAATGNGATKAIDFVSSITSEYQARASGGATVAQRPDVERRSVASLLNFECTAIAAWLQPKEDDASGRLGLHLYAGDLEARTATSKRKRRVRRVLVRLRYASVVQHFFPQPSVLFGVCGYAK